VNSSKILCLLALSAAVLLTSRPRVAAQTSQPTAAPQSSSKPPSQAPGRPAASSATAAAKPLATVGQPAARYVNCHALETHTNAQPAVVVVVFTQRDKPDHARLSDLLKESDSAAVELRTIDGKWHKATLVRLRTCFGRGMLFLAADSGVPHDREDFLLRFPPKKIS
jgi:hypothetical protein